MRKPAPSLHLAIFLILVCGLQAQQAPSPPNQGSQSQGSQDRSHPNTQSQPSTTLRVDVNLVNVFVTVTDPHGAPVGGLARENFLLKEDDREQQIKVFDRE